ncbi:hypothetical protein HF521_009016 [Silurus meridionalis]|uniref:Caspase-6 n=1 Tax=Silurus meridionalis TaxID=175797 RepID=A0A8T0BSY2_SILME|nr:hypothetical protein HF521_009016 [Silurus meridionalis]
MMQYLDDKYSDPVKDELLDLVLTEGPRFRTTYIDQDKVGQVKKRAVAKAELMSLPATANSSTPQQPGPAVQVRQVEAQPPPKKKMTLAAFFKKNTPVASPHQLEAVKIETELTTYLFTPEGISSDEDESLSDEEYVPDSGRESESSVELAIHPKIPDVANKGKACAGEKHENAVTGMMAVDGDDDEVVEEAANICTIPAGSDFIMCYSVAPGFFSYRDPNSGTFYIQDLCETLKQHGPTMEFTEILTLVNMKVSRLGRDFNNIKQMPCFTSMLTKKLYFRLEEYMMNHTRRGKALIFNHETFVKSKDRYGTNKDRDNIIKRFQALGFEVNSYNDQRKAEVLEEIRKAASDNHADADCFACIFLTRGDEGEIKAYDD